MKTQPIQFNRQKMTILLFAGLILALAVGLARTGADVSGSAFQPAPLTQVCAYSPQPGHGGSAVGQVDCSGADSLESESRFLPWFQGRSIKGRSAGASGTNF